MKHTPEPGYMFVHLVNCDGSELIGDHSLCKVVRMAAFMVDIAPIPVDLLEAAIDLEIER